MENLETAFLLMVVGMATVFVILLIVIYLVNYCFRWSTNMLRKKSYLPNRLPAFLRLFPVIS